MSEEAIDTNWSETWKPSEAAVNFVRGIINMVVSGGLWVVKETGHVYQVDHQHGKITLIQGDPNDEHHWHDKNKIIFQTLGYLVDQNPFLGNPCNN